MNDIIDIVYGLISFIGLFMVLRTFSCGVQSLALLHKDYNFRFKGYGITFLCFLIIWFLCWSGSTRSDWATFVAPFYAFQLALLLVTAVMEALIIMRTQSERISVLEDILEERT